MCYSPFIVKNLNRFNNNYATYAYKDTVSAYLSVPCGVCAQCTSLRQTYWLERVQLMCKTHYMFFGTLTYRDGALPHTRVYHHLDGSRRWYSYADTRDFSLMIKRLRKNGNIPRGCKYICCSEYGGRTHRPHFHFLLFVPRGEQHIYSFDRKEITIQYNEHTPLNLQTILFDTIIKEWRRNLGSTRAPKWQNLCDYIVSSDGRRTYDFQYVSSDGINDSSKVAAYVTKYILKFDSWLRKLRQALYNNLTPEDYLELWKIIRTKMVVSCSFAGFSKRDANSENIAVYQSYIDKCVDNSRKSGSLFLRFYDTHSGVARPMSKYLERKYVPVNTSIEFLQKQQQCRGETPYDDHVNYDAVFEHAMQGDYQYRDRLRYQSKRIYDFLDYCNRNSDVQFLIDKNHG